MNINNEKNKAKKHRCHICEDIFDNIELHFLNEHSNDIVKEEKNEDSESLPVPDHHISIVQDQRENDHQILHFLNEHSNSNKDNEIITEEKNEQLETKLSLDNPNTIAQDQRRENENQTIHVLYELSNEDNEIIKEENYEYSEIKSSHDHDTSIAQDQRRENEHLNIAHEKVCEYCDKSFSEAHQLNRHIHTVHEGRKDHKCESCGKSFTEAATLKHHIHRVHEAPDIFQTHSPNTLRSLK